MEIPVCFHTKGTVPEVVFRQNLPERSTIHGGEKPWIFCFPVNDLWKQLIDTAIVIFEVMLQDGAPGLESVNTSFG